MRLLVACLFAACAAVAGNATPVPQEKEKEKPNPEKLVGKWKLTKTSGEFPKDGGAVVEYTKDGKMTITLTVGDNTIEMKGKYKLDKHKIDYTVKLPNGEDKSEILTIKKLTDGELVTTDPEDIKEEFERVKAEKKN
jgi:uncharacterized protein (TIGR03066 family)